MVEAQAALVARWMLVGFVHGVMNTDNMAISGETIDYGPCAFMDAFDPATVFSSIDHGGRYAYGNQPRSPQWNLARLAEALLPLLADEPDAAIEVAQDDWDVFATRLRPHCGGDGHQAGLGAPRPGPRRRTCVDSWRAGPGPHPLPGWPACSGRTARSGRRAGAVRRLDPPLAGRCARGPRPPWTASMDEVNPVYVPRNHLVEEALAAATARRPGAVPPAGHGGLAALSTAGARPGGYAGPAPAGVPPAYVTYCGT